MGDQIELLPCPFCDGEARQMRVMGASGPYVRVECRSCRISKSGHDWDALATAWNTRTTTPAQAANVLLEYMSCCSDADVSTILLAGLKKTHPNGWELSDRIKFDAAFGSALRAIAEGESK